MVGPGVGPLVTLQPLEYLNLYGEATSSRTVDIETGFENRDLILVTFAEFPKADLDLDNCFLDFTSHPSGLFSSGPTDSLRFSEAINVGSSTSHLEWKRSKLDTIDRTTVTGVRFRIAAVNNCDVRILSVRLIPRSGFIYTGLDANTAHGWLEPTSNKTGSNFAPFSFGPVFRAAEPSSPDDPRPIDVELDTVFTSGSLTTSGAGEVNQIDWYLRELAVDYNTQLDLNTVTMEELAEDYASEQPDFGDANFSPRTMSDLDIFNQSDLTGDTQFSIEREDDSLASAYIKVTLKWNSNYRLLQIIDSEDRQYNFTNLPELDANQRYLVYISLQENTMQIKINELTEDNLISTSIYDTDKILDQEIFHRRKGRFGWGASFRDGDATIEGIRPRTINWGEYKSLQFESLTPVEGSELYATVSPDKELVTSFSGGPFGGIPQADTEKKLSDWSYRIQSDEAYHGIAARDIVLDDFENTVIEFNLWAPNTTILAGAEYYALLIGERTNITHIPLKLIKSDQWHNVKIPLKGYKDETVSGKYDIAILQASEGIGSPWWVDRKISVRRRAFDWQARAQGGDPWGYESSRWIPFWDNINNPYKHVQFPDRGNFLQVAGKALRQNSRLTEIKFKPRYSTLGRLVWDDQAQPLVQPVAAFTPSGSGMTRTLNGSASSTPSGYIINWQWFLGDIYGTTKNGKIISHTFDYTGTYNVTLEVTNSYGFKHSITQQVSIS